LSIPNPLPSTPKPSKTGMMPKIIETPMKKATGRVDFNDKFFILLEMRLSGAAEQI
jgi:hypothetical protein